MTEPDPGRDPWFVIVSGPVGRLVAVLAILEVVSQFVRPVLDWVRDVIVP